MIHTELECGFIKAGIAEGLNESTYPVLSAVAWANGSPSARDVALEVGTDRSVVSRRAATLASARVRA